MKGTADNYREALQSIRRELDTPRPDPASVRRAWRIADQALAAAVSADPVADVAVEMLRTIEELTGELQNSLSTAKNGEMWVCQEIPTKLKNARHVAAMARSLGVKP